jgi:hypothetical protein
VEILVSVETVVVVLLGILVAGLLRSHAEILRRLDAGTPGAPSPARPEPPAEGLSEAFDVAGTTLSGDAVKIAVAGALGATLLAFLSSGCLSCGAFWRAFREGEADAVPGGARLVVVTKDSDHESPSRLRELAPEGIPLVMSSEAWDRYRVAGSPYFVLVDGPTSSVRGEGTAEAWHQVAALLRDAIADHAPAEDDAGRRPAPPSGGDGDGRPGAAARLARADAELAAAGIGPGHPSLYGRDRGTGDAGR